MRRGIEGREHFLLPPAVVCSTLVLLLGAAVATVVVARALEPTNGSAGGVPAISAVCFVAGVLVLWNLAAGRRWARYVTSVLSLAAMIVGLAAQVLPLGYEATIIRLFGWMIICAALGLAFLWTPLPPRASTKEHL